MKGRKPSDPSHHHGAIVSQVHSGQMSQVNQEQARPTIVKRKGKTRHKMDKRFTSNAEEPTSAIVGDCLVVVETSVTLRNVNGMEW